MPNACKNILDLMWKSRRWDTVVVFVAALLDPDFFLYVPSRLQPLKLGLAAGSSPCSRTRTAAVDFVFDDAGMSGLGID